MLRQSGAFKMPRLLSVFFILVITTAFVYASNGLYTIVAPATIMPHSKYTISVNLHKSDEPCEFTVGVIGLSHSKLKKVKLDPFTSKQIKIKFRDIKSGEYNLSTAGVCGTEFRELTKLNFESQKCMILIQTDKPAYKPDDLVQFRVLILRKSTKPANLEEPVSIAIFDSEDNRIKNVDNAEFTHGVYSGELQLSAFPILGKWSILVTAGDEKAQKNFDVEKSVLSRYSISIAVPKYVAAKNGKLNARVTATYTYFKNVKGIAVVTIKPTFKPDQAVSKTIPIDGVAGIDFDIENELKFDFKISETNYIINLLVKDNVTGAQLEQNKEITVHRDLYRIQTVRAPSYFNYDVPFHVTVLVKNYDGTPIQDFSSPVVVKLTEKNGGGYTKEENGNLGTNGMATVTFTIPNKQEYESFELKAKYFDVESFVGSIRKEQKRNVDDSFKIEAQPQKATLKDTITVTVSSGKGLDYFFYQVIGRGKILESHYVKVPAGQTRYDFQIRPSLCMIPTVSIYVYCIEDGEIVYDERRVTLEQLPNTMEITAPYLAEPGQDVDISITSKPNSFVGLVGVDQSVLINKDSNDFLAAAIFTQMRNFRTDTTEEAPKNDQPGRYSGVVTITNAKLPPFHIATPPGVFLEDSADFAVREDFPETWLWTNIDSSGESGEVAVKVTVPDTITTFTLTGFSLSPNFGFGFVKRQVNITVYKPFFISTHLPYSVKRGEVIAIPAIVNNYQDTDAKVTITFDNTENEFDFIGPSEEIDDVGDEVRTIRARIKKNSVVSKVFLVRPKKVGLLSLNLKAVTATGGDSIKKVLICEAEGIRQYVNKEYLMNLEHINVQNEEIFLDMKHPVPDSVHTRLTVVGDFLAPAVKNIDQLIRKPWGCGEQNMVNFVPIIFILKYLEFVHKLTAAILAKALEFLLLGFQRELTFQYDDTSYTAFGKSDKSGSTWLTAYVARSFRQAQKYIDIEDQLIEKPLGFLVKNQAADGNFPEVGRVFDTHYASKTGRPLTLTAFVLLALMENQSKFPQHSNAISKGLDFLANNIGDKTDTYDLAIATYALQLGKHHAKDASIARLKDASTIDGLQQYWRDETQSARPANVEITSYALLALLDAGAGEETLPIIQYLISKRNSRGGFDSSQDTVLGLQALVKFASKLAKATGIVDVNFRDNLNNRGKVTTTPDNSLLLQTRILHPSPSSVSVAAKGNGSVLVQASYRYNVVKEDEFPKFTLKPTVKESASPEFLVLSVCINFNGDGEQKTSNMALMEVSLPSGYIADPDNLAELEKFDRVKRVETKNGDTVVILYFDYLDSTEICPEIKGHQAHRVAKQKPASIEAYDYYRTSRRATAFYQIPAS